MLDEIFGMVDGMGEFTDAEKKEIKADVKDAYDQEMGT
jgi:hypothetical protein